MPDTTNDGIRPDGMTPETTHSQATEHQDNTMQNALTCRQINDLVAYMTRKHSKALFLRLDLTNAIDAPVVMERKHITGILVNTGRALERKFRDKPNKPDMKYVWTTEQSAHVEHPHYHLFVGVNGHALRNGYAVMAAMQPYVQRAQQSGKRGLVHFSESNGTYGIMCDRNREDYEQQKARAINTGYYLAKFATKDNNPKWARFSSASHLPFTNPLPVQS